MSTCDWNLCYVIGFYGFFYRDMRIGIKMINYSYSTYSVLQCEKCDATSAVRYIKVKGVLGPNVTTNLNYNSSNQDSLTTLPKDKGFG